MRRKVNLRGLGDARGEEEITTETRRKREKRGRVLSTKCAKSAKEIPGETILFDSIDFYRSLLSVGQ